MQVSGFRRPNEITVQIPAVSREEAALKFKRQLGLRPELVIDAQGEKHWFLGWCAQCEQPMFLSGLSVTTAEGKRLCKNCGLQHDRTHTGQQYMEFLEKTS